jgi:phenylacetate-CoA ligase
MSLGRTLNYVRLARQGRLEGEELARLQVARLRAIIRHAWEQSPYWHAVLESAGLRPGAVDSVSDLQRLPVTRREDLQVAYGLRTTDSYGGDVVVRRTAGSLGKPLRLHAHRADLETEALGWIRTWRRLGLRLRDRQVALGEPDDPARGGRDGWLRQVGVLREDRLDLQDPPARTVDELARLAPDVLRGTPSSLETVAAEVERRETEYRVRPRLVLCSGGRLGDRTRSRVARVLGADVHDIYGATEAGCVAWRHPGTGCYHVNSDLVIVEVLDRYGAPVAPGRPGEVVVTNLFCRATPVLRYSLGDRAIRSERDPDGPDVRCLEGLLGRSAEQIELRDGRMVSPYHFLPDEVEGIVTYRVRQVRPDEVCLLVVPGHGFEESALRRACAGTERNLGGACRVHYRLLDALPPLYSAE